MVPSYLYDVNVRDNSDLSNLHLANTMHINPASTYAIIFFINPASLENVLVASDKPKWVSVEAGLMKKIILSVKAGLLD